MSKILIVDDFEDNIFLLKEMLSTLNFETTSVPNGKDAVETVSKGGIDLILMDIEMPVLNGFEASEKIRELPPPINSIPIIAISAHNFEFFADKMEKSGINDYISKPYTIVKLQSVFRKYGVIE